MQILRRWSIWSSGLRLCETLWLLRLYAWYHFLRHTEFPHYRCEHSRIKAISQHLVIVSFQIQCAGVQRRNSQKHITEVYEKAHLAQSYRWRITRKQLLSNIWRVQTKMCLNHDLMMIFSDFFFLSCKNLPFVLVLLRVHPVLLRLPLTVLPFI